MIIICAVGMEWESKAQNFLVAIIVAAIFNFIIGAFMGPKSEKEHAEGFIGFNSEFYFIFSKSTKFLLSFNFLATIFAENWPSDFRFSEKIDQSFFSVFAIFFPSVTGLQAGANISGDLKDPASSIPKGTLLALLISAISYVVFVLIAGGSALRDATGDISDIMNGTLASCADTNVRILMFFF